MIVHQVANLCEEGTIGRHVTDRARVGLVPSIEFNLKPNSLQKKGIVLGRKLGHDLVETSPKGIR